MLETESRLDLLSVCSSVMTHVHREVAHLPRELYLSVADIFILETTSVGFPDGTPILSAGSPANLVGDGGQVGLSTRCVDFNNS